MYYTQKNMNQVLIYQKNLSVLISAKNCARQIVASDFALSDVMEHH